MKLMRTVCMLAIITSSLFAQLQTYPDYATLKENLEKIKNAHPNLVQLESLGTTAAGRQVLLLKLGVGEMDAKPAVLLVAGVNVTDLAGTEIIMQFIESSINNYGRIDSITNRLNQTTFYIFPRVSPDATEALFLSPAYARRLNGKSLDLDKDGKADEDGYDDLNKDGTITAMRITESGGTWIEDSEYPGLLIQADAGKNESGTYTLHREGFDNDGDGSLNEDEPGGTEFNKNFSYHYKYFEIGSGDFQISELETKAVADFAFAHNNIAAVFCFSDNDNLIKPWESSQKPGFGNNNIKKQEPLNEIDKADAPYFNYISDAFKTITGYTETGLPADAQGSFSEWAYYHFGRWSFSTPAWVPREIKSVAGDSAQTGKTSDIQKPVKPDGGKVKSYDQRLWERLKATGQEKSFVVWEEIKHPDFPDKKVEVGGYKPLVYTNPPADSIVSISRTYFPFFMKLSEWLPAVSVEELKVESLDENVYRITLNIVNKGYLSSNPQAAVDNKWAPKIKVALTLAKDQKLASGKVLNFIDNLPGSGGSKSFSWVVLGKRGQSVQIEAGSPMTGLVKKTVDLK